MNKDLGDKGNKGGNDSPYDKKEVLYQAMYMNQPDFDDFKGYTGYSRRVLEADREWLSKRNAEILYRGEKEADDDFARYMEPVVTYILNRDETFPSRDNFSFLASDYDDKYNGTDIVFGIKESKTDNFMVFSIDVATGTLLKNIQNKFRTSLDKHDGTSYVKYCMHEDQRWREPNAPHFIIGMSPASQDKAISKFTVVGGQLRGRGADLDTDFLVLSELREQIITQLAVLEKKPKTEEIEQRIAKLNDLRPAIVNGLYRALGIGDNYPTKEDRLNAFREKYSEKSAELMNSDVVYGNIVTASRQRTRGAKALDNA